MLYKMPGDECATGRQPARLYMGFICMPILGKKLNSMGTEFAQSTEWNHDAQLQWWLLQFDKRLAQGTAEPDPRS